VAKKIVEPVPMDMNAALYLICPHLQLDDQPLLRHLGDNNLTYGIRTNYVRVSFDTSHTNGRYDLLRLKHIQQGRLVDEWTIDLTSARHRPNPEYRPSVLEGGYYWSHDSKFYCWVPVHVDWCVGEILKFTGVDSG
jgi:hypothetical protein